MSELRVGIAGLGAAAKLILPYFGAVEGVRLAGAADLRTEAREAFTRATGFAAYSSVEELCRAGDVDAVWIETPTHLHCAHAVTAAKNGKHAICAKPLAVTLQECDRMIEAAARADVKLLQGHSKIFDSPIHAMGEVVREGRLGRVIQIDSWVYNDWLRRPRLAEELDEQKGAGFILRQAPHPVDIVTHIANARATFVRAVVGKKAAEFAANGHCTALIGFETGAVASVSLNGYGYFDTTELTFGIGSMGETHPDPRTTKPRKRKPGPLSEDEKHSATDDTPPRKPGAAQPFFGLTLVSCEHGLIRQSPKGLLIYTDEGCEEIEVPPQRGRAAELIELRDAIAEKRDVFPNGAWGKANLEICLAILRSAREGRDIALKHQVGPG